MHDLYRFFDATPVGRIVSRLTTDVDVLQEMFAAGAMTIALDGLRLAGIVGFMCWINWRLALTSLVLLPFMVLGVDFFRRAARRTYRLIRERIGRINGFLQEAIGRTVRSEVAQHLWRVPQIGVATRVGISDGGRHGVAFLDRTQLRLTASHTDRHRSCTRRRG